MSQNEKAVTVQLEEIELVQLGEVLSMKELKNVASREELGCRSFIGKAADNHLHEAIIGKI